MSENPDLRLSARVDLEVQVALHLDTEPKGVRMIGMPAMKTPEPPFFDMRIRGVVPADFEFIRSLAAQFPTFTVPSEYILWFFTRFHPAYCRILERASGESVAYLLAMATSDPPKGIAVWQVAASGENQAFALEHFTAHLRSLADRERATSISFSLEEASTSRRLVRLLAKQFFDCEMESISQVPVGQGEREFRVTVKKKNA